jgi:hypothetical protein
MSNYTNAVRLIKELLPNKKNVVSLSISLLEVLDDDYPECAIFSQCVYWSDRTDDEDGWFYKSYQDWKKECRVKERTCRRKLESLKARGWVETEVRQDYSGQNQLYVRLIGDKWIEDMMNFTFEGDDPADKMTGANEGSGQNDRRVRTDLPEGADKMTVSSIYTKITPENTSENTSFHAEDSKEEPTLDSTTNESTCPGPAAKSKSIQVQPKTRKKTRKADEIYAAMYSFDDFMRFWKWYKKDVISLPGASHDGGNRAEAGEVWLRLEANNFFGLGKATFWQAIALQLEKMKSTRSSKGEVIGILHACRFLGGGEKGEPDWLVTYEESQCNTETDTSMIVANVETSSLESIRQQILAILSELNMTAALPPQVQEKTGCKILSELNQEYAVKYLNYLKRHKEKKEQEAA